MRKKIKNELTGLKKSFSCAFSGIKRCIATERNMRIHITVSAFVLYFSIFYELSRGEYAVLFLLMGMVLVAETLNTSIEEVVDIIAPNYSKQAQIAKDLAAGAVFIAALIAFAGGVILFFDIEVMQRIIEYHIQNIPALIGVLLAIGVSIVFIFTKSARSLRRKPPHSTKKI